MSGLIYKYKKQLIEKSCKNDIVKNIDLELVDEFSNDGTELDIFITDSFDRTKEMSLR